MVRVPLRLALIRHAKSRPHGKHEAGLPKVG
jgi:hypothetical protein